mmetsp:Transcript_42196/g.84566  ORF Transcript_42196/g.84566 Transcript_42196/m.84566 type:complete len:102 (+) Transcript_42196:750-1055(+)
MPIETRRSTLATIGHHWQEAMLNRAGILLFQKVFLPRSNQMPVRHSGQTLGRDLSSTKSIIMPRCPAACSREQLEEVHRTKPPMHQKEVKYKACSANSNTT